MKLTTLKITTAEMSVMNPSRTVPVGLITLKLTPLELHDKTSLANYGTISFLFAFLYSIN